MRQLSSASEVSWNVESALHDFERRMRELQRVVQGLSKDVENYQDFIRPIARSLGLSLGRRRSDTPRSLSESRESTAMFY
jgi:hypothetical protein